MNWTKLIIGTIVLYVIYYIIIIAMDLMKSKKSGSDTGYEVIDMDFEDEAPQNIEADYMTEPIIDQTSPRESKVETKIQMGEVERQGIPVDDFLKLAKEMSTGVEF